MLKMNEQEIYQKIGELLWSIMPNEAIEIYFIGDIVKLLYYSYKIRKKLEITHRLSRSTILYAYV